jgi:hypothetical protein
MDFGMLNFIIVAIFLIVILVNFYIWINKL